MVVAKKTNRQSTGSRNWRLLGCSDGTKALGVTRVGIGQPSRDSTYQTVRCDTKGCDAPVSGCAKAKTNDAGCKDGSRKSGGWGFRDSALSRESNATKQNQDRPTNTPVKVQIRLVGGHVSTSLNTGKICTMLQAMVQTSPFLDTTCEYSLLWIFLQLGVGFLEDTLYGMIIMTWAPVWEMMLGTSILGKGSSRQSFDGEGVFFKFTIGNGCSV